MTVLPKISTIKTLSVIETYQVILTKNTKCRVYSVYWGYGCGFFQGTSSKERAFCLLAPLKQMPFLTISNDNFFFKLWGTRLGAIVAPNKGLE